MSGLQKGQHKLGRLFLEAWREHGSLEGDQRHVMTWGYESMRAAQDSEGYLRCIREDGELVRALGCHSCSAYNPFQCDATTEGECRTCLLYGISTSLIQSESSIPIQRLIYTFLLPGRPQRLTYFIRNLHSSCH